MMNGREGAINVVWKHSGPGRILAFLALAWEHSWVNALLLAWQSQLRSSLLINTASRWLALDSWDRSGLALALNRSAMRAAAVTSGVARRLTKHLEYSLAWRAGRTLLAWVCDARAFLITASIFPFTRDVSWSGWLLAAFAFLFPILPTSINLLWAWLIAAAVFLGHVNLPNKRPSPVAIALALFGIALVWATAGSVAPGPSLTALLLWTTYLALYMAVKQAAQRWANAQAIVTALMTGGIILAAIAVAQWMAGVETSAAWVDARLHQDIATRAFSVFDNPNILAGHLALLIPVALLAWVGYHHLPWRLFALASLGFMGAGLLVTLSRGALLAVFLSIGLIAILRDRRYLVILLALAVLFIALSPPFILDRLIGAITFEDSSARYRITIWLASLRMLQDFWLTGTGLGPASFAEVYPLYRIAGTPAAHTHNLYLQLVIELGLAGALAFCLFMVAWARWLLQGLKGDAAWLVVGILAAMGGAALHGLVENIWYSPKSLMLFWLLLGLGSGLCSHRGPGEETT